MEVIRSLIDEIVLTPEKSELRIDLKGELAGILSLASGKEKPDAKIRTGLDTFSLRGIAPRSAKENGLGPSRPFSSASAVQWLRGQDLTFVEPLQSGVRSGSVRSMRGSCAMQELQ
jgi:hypothetical protein